MPAGTFDVSTNFALANFLASPSFGNVSVALTTRLPRGRSNETYHVPRDLLAMRLSRGLQMRRTNMIGRVVDRQDGEQKQVGGQLWSAFSRGRGSRDARRSHGDTVVGEGSQRGGGRRTRNRNDCRLGRLSVRAAHNRHIYPGTASAQPALGPFLFGSLTQKMVWRSREPAAFVLTRRFPCARTVCDPSVSSSLTASITVSRWWSRSTSCRSPSP